MWGFCGLACARCVYRVGAIRPLAHLASDSSLASLRFPFPLLLIGAAAVFSAGGCTPAQYRLQADRETYSILNAKAAPVDRNLPPRHVEPPVESRNFDPTSPDCPPMPPDDPLAHREMHCPGDQPGYQHWHDQGHVDWIESPLWERFLELDADGRLDLSAERAVDLGLVHSREYQFELESLYLSALALTFERFEFDLQWFGGNTSDFFHFGRGANEQNALSTNSFLGFSKSFACGGQLLVNFANSFVWEFTGDDTMIAPSELTVNFVQPLLRGAFRDVRLENLTQTERNVLYQVRNFARFRKRFYVDLVSGEQGYLDLLLQLQAIRNLEQNVYSLEQNLRAHEALAEAGIVSPLQVDQVFQSYQAGRLRLIRAENALENSLDAYKVQLGLPPELEVELDDSQLEPFELTSAEVESLDEELNELLTTFRELEDLPAPEQLRDGYAELAEFLEDLENQSELVDQEWERWQDQPVEPLERLEEAAERQREARQAMRQRLDDLQPDIARLRTRVAEGRENLDGPIVPPEAQRFVRLAREAVNQVADLFVVQTQIRAYLIELPEVDLPERRALQIALRERLDLKNEQAEVVDAWRKIRVAKDALEADLDVFLDANVATRPGSSNPVDFSAAASSYRVGVEFDAPLNRLAERNTYRAELVDYQRERREFIARRDTIVQAVRRDLRALEAERLNFEISRQSLVAAARQVELARLQLLAPDPGGDSSATQDALNALNSLLDAKNSLIASWVAYETARLQLLLDTERLQLDEQGQALDDAEPSDPTEPSLHDEPPAREQHSGENSSDTAGLDYFGPGESAQLPPPVRF